MANRGWRGKRKTITAIATIDRGPTLDAVWHSAATQPSSTPFRIYIGRPAPSVQIPLGKRALMGWFSDADRELSGSYFNVPSPLTHRCVEPCNLIERRSTKIPRTDDDGGMKDSRIAYRRCSWAAGPGLLVSHVPLACFGQPVVLGIKKDDLAVFACYQTAELPMESEKFRTSGALIRRMSVA
ncbi:hypothetical protein BJY01DRAFT_78468 [Aspergillus pseudoustus]|uniref:Uncharacterized protein n=1 Tax=Aspergillus pseudoustus TaxID=1810923 RepID=A0ABR4KN55_9EURO